MDGGQVAKSKLTHRKDNKVQFYWCFDKRECRPTENFVCVIAYRYATGCGLHCDANGVDAFPAAHGDCFPNLGFASGRGNQRRVRIIDGRGG